jgi:hypothetical protein
MELYLYSPYMSHGVYCDNFTFTLAYIYMPTHVHTHPTHVCTNKYICTYTHTSMFACAQTPPPHTHTRTHTCLHMHTYALTHTYIYLCTCAYTTTHYQSPGYTKRKTVMSDAFVLHSAILLSSCTVCHRTHLICTCDDGIKITALWDMMPHNFPDK